MRRVSYPDARAGNFVANAGNYVANSVVIKGYKTRLRYLMRTTHLDARRRGMLISYVNIQLSLNGIIFELLGFIAFGRDIAPVGRIRFMKSFGLNEGQVSKAALYKKNLVLRCLDGKMTTRQAAMESGLLQRTLAADGAEIHRPLQENRGQGVRPR